MMTTLDPRTDQSGQRSDCRHCISENKDCGRAHFPILSYEWQTGNGRTTQAPAKLATPKQLGFIQSLLSSKQLTDRKRKNRQAKIENGEFTAKEAGAMIDELQAEPDKQRPASEKQVDFVKRLLAEKDLPEGNRNSTEAAIERGLGTHEASGLIDWLLTFEKAETPTKVITPEGMHLLNGEVFKVQRAVHGSGNLYAKRLENGSFEYARGAIRKLSEKTLMSLEDAKEYGRLYGICCVCSRTLTNEDSIEAGIGPICAQTF